LYSIDNPDIDTFQTPTREQNGLVLTKETIESIKRIKVLQEKAEELMKEEARLERKSRKGGRCKRHATFTQKTSASLSYTSSSQFLIYCRKLFIQVSL
jgi:hypothetical protein